MIRNHLVLLILDIYNLIYNLYLIISINIDIQLLSITYYLYLFLKPIQT